MLKKLIFVLLLGIGLLAAVLLGNTFLKGSKQLEAAPVTSLAVDSAVVSKRLSEVVRLRTISSREDPNLSAQEFLKLHATLEKQFPAVHQTLKREVVGGLSLLYTWQGTNPQAKPVLLLAHQDIVPIAPGTEKDWAVDPFEGIVKDGFVWGRGAWDNKGNLMSQLEAVEALIKSGFKPERTIYLAMGADEEIGGRRGAAEIAKLLESRQQKLEWVLDEGLLVTEGIMPGLSKPAALIGIAEKGYLTVVLRLAAKPGHSSMPPAKGSSAIAMLSAALKRIDDDQMPAGIRGVAKEMFDTVAPEMGFSQRVILSNLWLFGPLVQIQLEKAASTNAMLRTTTALTIISAGNKENVLPGRAEATINYRLLPGDTKEQVVERARAQVAAALPGSSFELFALPGAVDSSKVTPTSSSAYQLINRTVRQTFPDALVAPGLMLGGTDSIHFSELSDHIFKFSPIRAKQEDLVRFHGTNERISIQNYTEAIRFYHQLISVGGKAP